MNISQIMASTALATILITGASAHGLLGGGGFSGGLGGGLSGMSGRGLAGNGDFNGQGQLSGPLPSKHVKTSIADKSDAVKDGATHAVDKSKDQAGSVTAAANGAASATRTTPTTPGSPAAASRPMTAPMSEGTTKPAASQTQSVSADQTLGAGPHNATSGGSLDAAHSTTSN